MKSLIFSAILCVLLVVLTSNLFAANPADLTVNHRPFVSEFFKVGYDGGPRFAAVNLPVGKSTSVCLLNWQNEKGDSSFSELYVAKSIVSWLDAALDSTLAGGVPVHNLAFDVHYKIAGLGVVVPLSFESVSFGPRVSVKNFSAFLTIPTVKNANNFYGISYKFFGITTEGAYGTEKYFLRASRAFSTSFGILIPELRTSFSKKENAYGFALGFIPRQ